MFKLVERSANNKDCLVVRGGPPNAGGWYIVIMPQQMPFWRLYYPPSYMKTRAPTLGRGCLARLEPGGAWYVHPFDTRDGLIGPFPTKEKALVMYRLFEAKP